MQRRLVSPLSLVGEVKGRDPYRRNQDDPEADPHAAGGKLTLVAVGGAAKSGGGRSLPPKGGVRSAEGGQQRSPNSSRA